ncbi:MAG: dCMP deaminase family protein [Dehalococcoidia bacterium]|nr:dCMP deaminase family protein [Dehalococcoidia bacterium]
MPARPSMDEYFMQIAFAVRARANCRGQRVGALIVKDARIIATGYNGTPSNMQNCEEGGCYRCANREQFPSGAGYDLCICVHAEQNAILAAARFGIATEGAVMYTTTRPCFGCTKELLQSRIVAVYYLHDWEHPNPDVAREYDKIQARFEGGVKRLPVPDPDAHWATAGRAAPAEETGHVLPG